MSTIRDYHRPTTVEDALVLLSREGVVTAPLAGGTSLNGLPSIVPDEVVDLQMLGLGEITYRESILTFGAMTTLSQLISHEMTPAALVALSKREAPNTIRNAATVGGTVGVANPGSPLLAGLLAYDATVTMVGSEGSQVVALADLLADRSLLGARLIVSVEIVFGGSAAWESTERTPADTPIVLVVGRRDRAGTVHLAATGVADTPVKVNPENLDVLAPPSDFRGSTEYRRHLARVLIERVLSRLEGGESL